VFDKATIIDRFGEALGAGRRFDKPFPLYNFRPFSAELYEQILANLPDDEAYIDLVHPDAMLPNRRSARLVFPLQESRLQEKLTGEQRDFWLEMIDVLCDSKLRDIFKRAFEPELKKRFGAMPLSEIPALPVPMLTRDLAFYKINIHPDIDTKVITTQYYLPRDISQSHLGTSIYRRNILKKFELVRKLEFVPGASYAFAVSKYSWHAVDPVSEADGPRNSLMLTYFRVPGIDY
jgi:hypothetical protein